MRDRSQVWPCSKGAILPVPRLDASRPIVVSCWRLLKQSYFQSPAGRKSMKVLFYFSLVYVQPD